MTGRFPWGAGAAPALDCHDCHRRIGKTAAHFIFDGNLLLCGRCAVMSNSSVRTPRPVLPRLPRRVARHV